MAKFKQTQIGEPQGRGMLRPVLERVIEADEAPEGAVKVPDNTPTSEWTQVGTQEEK